MNRTNIKALSAHERKVYDACYNGWWLSGRYSASFGNHRRTFEADSKEILFSDVYKWFRKHELNHANDHVLVRCVQAF